jgi:hypothetical protein
LISAEKSFAGGIFCLLAAALFAVIGSVMQPSPESQFAGLTVSFIFAFRLWTDKHRFSGFIPYCLPLELSVYLKSSTESNLDSQLMH